MKINNFKLKHSGQLWTGLENIPYQYKSMVIIIVNGLIISSDNS